MKRLPLHPLGRLAGLILFTYLLCAGWVYWRQDLLLFHPSPVPADFDRQQFQRYEYTVKNQDITLRGWLKQEQPISADYPLIIYYGGNAEEMSDIIRKHQQWPHGALLAMNYRGFGASEGQPSAEGMKSDALKIFDQVVQQQNIAAEHIVLVGRSMGSGVATYIASQRPVESVVLVTPFDRLVNVSAHHYPWLPVSQLLNHHFDSLSVAPAIKVPLLMLLAEQDAIVPHQFSESLLSQWGGSKQQQTIANSNHNSINLSVNYWQAIKVFIQQ